MFPNLKLYIHEELVLTTTRVIFNMCGNVDTLEVYPDLKFFDVKQTNDGDLLLLTNHGVFYEFIELSEFKCGNFERRCWRMFKLNRLCDDSINNLWTLGI